MSTRHRDYYEGQADAEAHNTAETFPLQPEGDSWVGALWGRHAHESSHRFGAVHAVRCTNPACPAQCCVCNLEFAPRGQVA